MVSLTTFTPNLPLDLAAFDRDGKELYINGLPLRFTSAIVTNTTIVAGTNVISAWNDLRSTAIAPGVTVTFQLPAGDITITDSFKGHPQGQQIIFAGASMIGAVPTAADFAVTGYTAPARSTDNGNHLLMLKARYGTRIRCSNTEFFDVRGTGHPPTIQRILAWTDNASTAGMYVYDGLFYSKIAFSLHGFGSTNMVLTNGGNHRAEGLFSTTGSGGFGLQVS